MDVKAKAAYTLTAVPGRNIIKADPSGMWTAADVNRYIDDILKLAKKFTGAWAFSPNIEKMAPITDIETSNALARFHEVLEGAKCKAIAFIEGGAVAIKAQAQRHQDTSKADKLVVNHFRNEEQAFTWLKSIGI